MSKTGRPRRIPATTFARLATKERIELREIIPLTADAASLYEKAKNDLSTAEMIGDPDRITAARVALEQTKELVSADLAELVFWALPGSEYKQLVRAHPPNAEDQAEHQRIHGVPAEFDADTFAPALISASCVEPKMTESEVLSLRGSESGWSEAEYNRLFQLALMVNQSIRSIQDPDF